MYGYAPQTTEPAVQSQPIAHAQLQVSYVARPSGRNKPLNSWGDSICDWPNNLYPSCYCTCCCCYGMYIVAQSEAFFVKIWSWIISFLVFQCRTKQASQILRQLWECMWLSTLYRSLSKQYRELESYSGFPFFLPSSFKLHCVSSLFDR